MFCDVVSSAYTPATSSASPSKLKMAIMLDIMAIMLHCHNVHIFHLEYAIFLSSITINTYLQDPPFGINMGCSFDNEVGR